MGSFGSSSSSSETEERERRQLVVSQLSFGGFDASVSARDLANFLEFESAAIIWRCRVKTSWTPLDSFPDFDSRHAAAAVPTVRDDYARVVPHAFVQFASPEGARRALDAAGSCKLVLNGRVLRATCGAESSSFRFARRRTTDPICFSNALVEVGSLAGRDDYRVAWRGPDYGVDFVLDPFDGCCRVVFTRETPFSFKGTNSFALIKCDFKVEFLARDITEIKLYKDRAPFSLLLLLASAPYIYYRTADDDIHNSVPGNVLDDEDPWIRTTDFTPGGAIGRCNCYRISFSPRFGAKLEKALNYLRERRVPDSQPRYPLRVQKEGDYGSPMSDLFFCIQHVPGINFPILFLLNAVLHKGIVNQHQLSDNFFSLLRDQDDRINAAALQHIWSYRRALFDPTRRLKLVQDWLLKTSPKLLNQNSDLASNDTVEVRRLVITPTKAHCLPPEVELSNRVLRKYKSLADRFLRVTFMDEGMHPLAGNALNYSVAPIVRDITSQSYQQKTTVFARVKKILSDGFYLCGRKYCFLAFSSNQLRDRSAWFFAEDGTTTAQAVRKWMGRFSNRNVAKCAARMGQCFSSTYATVEVQREEVDPSFPDFEKNGYVFSDGIGKITPDLAAEVAARLGLTDNPPSAYQIRYAGYKGVVAIWPMAGEDNINVANRTGRRLFLRPSMNKFDSDHTTLEVVSWTRFQPGFLNRQIITLLCALSVPDCVFAEMQDSMVRNLDRIMVDPDTAFEVLTASCSEQGSTAAMMLSAGFTPQTEPHLRAMLSCVRSTQLGDLLAKARIFVPKGRWLMGCLDELGVLEQGQCFIQVSNPSLERCFVRHGLSFVSAGSRGVVVGTVAIAKNPCLHPGDVRILEAVDVPGLHHLVDCLVFPSKGERPHPNEASGSDLDGDLYFVTWDENLLPPGKRSWVPMDYTPAGPKMLSRQVQPEDIIEFFLKNMVNENLGVICNAHVVHADRSEYGALDENCLQLAELAATAVDFPKTGKLVTMPSSLRPKVYPDFMGKDEQISYKSDKILSKLYRKIKNIYSDEAGATDDLSTCALDDVPYDMDLEVAGAVEHLAEAWQSKCSYDGQLNALLGQYRVGSEGEVVTGHIWSLPKYNSRKQGELKERLKTAYSALRKEFRAVFENMGPDCSDLTDEEKGMFYESKASAWYQVTYHPKWVRKARELVEPDGDGAVQARLSFAWIAADYLVRIKVRHRDRGEFDESRAVDKLAAYLSERL